MMIAVLTAGIATIRNCLDYYEQKDFFYKNRDYAYIGMSYEVLKKGGSLTAEEEAGLVNKRYNRAFSKYKPLELLLLDSDEDGRQRYRKILLLACESTLASILTAAAIAQIWGTVNFENVIPAGSAVMCLELLMIEIYTVKLEKYRIPEILKGGFL